MLSLSHSGCVVIYYSSPCFIAGLTASGVSEAAAAALCFLKLFHDFEGRLYHRNENELGNALPDFDSEGLFAAVPP